jgi:aryl-alcohol dehydrogenase-like predicted oxidoreductase
MQTVRLGRTDAEVSVAGLGCGGASRLGMARGASAEDAARVVSRALDLGVTFIDTARAYGTEEAVGLGIRGRRDGLFLSTKVSPGRGDQLLTAAQLAESLDQSLQRLGTDHVDVFHLHGLALDHYDRAVEILVPELKRQQAAGKIRFLGVTEGFGRDTGHAMLTRALPDDHFDVIMVGFNLMNPSARARVFPLTLERDVGTLIMFAVRRTLSDPAALREAVASLAARGEVDPSQVDAEDPLGFLTPYAASGALTEVAYRFCRHEPGAQVILTGTGDIAHLDANLAAIEGPPLPPEALDRLKRLFGTVDSISGN